MPPARRLWDSNVVIDYLAGSQAIQPACDLIISQARAGNIEIYVSAIAELEVAYLEGFSEADSEQKIREFFSRPYIVPAAFDIPVAREARRLIRSHHLKPPDAAHLATAILHHVPLLETKDPDLHRVDGQEGNPTITIQWPRYEGTLPMLPP